MGELKREWTSTAFSQAPVQLADRFDGISFGRLSRNVHLANSAIHEFRGISLNSSKNMQWTRFARGGAGLSTLMGRI